MEGMPNVVTVAYEPLVLWIDPDHVQEEGGDLPHKVEVKVLIFILLYSIALHYIVLDNIVLYLIRLCQKKHIVQIIYSALYNTFLSLHLLLHSHRSFPLLHLSCDRISVRVSSSFLTVLWA